MNERNPAHAALLVMRMFREAKQNERMLPGKKTAAKIPFDAYDRDGRKSTHGDGTVNGVDDLNLMSYLTPTLEEQMNHAGSSLTGYSIMEELFDVEIRPFVEGEPIGVIQKFAVPSAAVSSIPSGQFRQEVLLRLRKRNDDAIARLLGE